MPSHGPPEQNSQGTFHCDVDHFERRLQKHAVTCVLIDKKSKQEGAGGGSNKHNHLPSACQRVTAEMNEEQTAERNCLGMNVGCDQHWFGAGHDLLMLLRD